MTWLLSGNTPEAVRAQAGKLASFVETHDVSPADVGLSLATTRTLAEHRAGVVAADRATAVRALVEYAAGRPTGVVEGVAAPGRTAFLFTGQGAQRAGMGLGLTFPAFIEALDAVAAVLDPHLDRPLRTILEEGPEETGYVQPALFAIEVAVFRLLESWGVKPDYLLGHSIGELAAAHVAGVLSLEDACTLVAARARLMQALPTGGAMVAVAASEDEVTLTEGVSIAAVNGPASVVLSGDEDAVLAVAGQFARTSRLKVSHAFHSFLMEPMLADFRAVAEKLTYSVPRIPIVTSGDVTSPEYWVSQVRDAVRFADGVRTLLDSGVTTFVEVGPSAVLTAMGQSCLREDERATFVPVLRKDRPEDESAATAVASLFVTGSTVDFPAFYAGGAAVELPTYAFQRKRYWLENPTGARVRGIAEVGQRDAAHPLLGAVVVAADSGGVVLTGRLSARTQPWLADHVVQGSMLFPGTAFVELAIRAGDEAGCGRLDELTLAAPLILQDAPVRLQVVVGPLDAERRSLGIYSQAEDASEWVQHGSGWLSSSADAAPVVTEWPPAGAVEIDVTSRYDELAAQGFDYGPVFAGLRRVWTVGSDLAAEVALPEHADATAFGLHPALLDAALHTIGLAGPTEDKPVLPFAWSGVSLHAAGASSLRVLISSDVENTVSLRATDSAGAPVLSVEALALRPIAADAFVTSRSAVDDSLFRVEWQGFAGEAVSGVSTAVLGAGFGLPGKSYVDLPELVASGVVPDVVFAPFVASEASPEAAREATHRLLALAQEWVGVDALASSRLVVVAEKAIATGPAEGVDDLTHAALWGVIRTAQLEYPDRFMVVDLDGGPLPLEAVLGAMYADEPGVAVRDGAVLVHRLAKFVSDAPVSLDPAGTVLVTGGTGVLGQLIARHLVTAHGVRNLLITSRRGAAAPGAAELVESLTSLGASVSLEACDLADRSAVSSLLAGIPASQPLTAVVHTAGVVDDGVLLALTPERMDAVLRPKIDAAWNLHSLTLSLDLAAFVLYSSAGGTLGAAGQANYSAANVFLDALAHHRAALGKPAVSLAWGLWSEGGMSGELADTDLIRMARSGVFGLSFDDGLELFDATFGTSQPSLVPVRLDMSGLRSDAHSVPAMLRGLVRGGVRRRAEVVDDSWSRIVALPAAERERALLDLVCGTAAVVLGHERRDAIDPRKGFIELGFDSLTAIELRNHLDSLTGQRLPATLIFDHPSAAALASFLGAGLADAPSPVDTQLAGLEAALASADSDDRLKAVARLKALVASLAPADEEIEDASADELFALLDEELESQG